MRHQEHFDEASTAASGAFKDEASRLAIQIAALQSGSAMQDIYKIYR